MKTWLLFVFVCSAAFTALGVEPQPRVKGDAIYLYCSASTQNTQEGIERYEDRTSADNFRNEIETKKHLYTFHPLQL